MLYPLEYRKGEGGGIIAWLPDLPGTHDQGATLEEAADRLRGVALSIIQSLIDDKEDIPDPSPAAGRQVVALPSQAWTKVLLYRALREKGWKKTKLAKALGSDQTGINRLLDPHHASKPEVLDQAFAALGYHYVPTVQHTAEQVQHAA